MRYYVVILSMAALLTVAKCDLADPLVQQHLKECADENSINEKDFVDFSKGPMDPSKVSNNIKCTIKCLLMKSNLMNAAGKFDADAFKIKYAQWNPAELQAALEKCKSLEDANQCEKAFKITSCIYDKKH